VADVVEAVLDTYRRERTTVDGKAEAFIHTLQRVGIEPFKAAANGARSVAKELA
jgi:sulfite reductase (NADPH) hemoprotein beta-component